MSDREASLKNHIEDLIDQHGVQLILQRIASICADKAEHIESNWQDKFEANIWISRMKAIDAVSARPMMKD